MSASDDLVDRIQKMANRIRIRVLEHTVKHGGYLSQACSSAEMFSALYLHLLNIGESLGDLIPKPFGRYDVPGKSKVYRCGGVYNGERAPHYDRFFLSPTHYALCLYATLIEVGRLAPESLNQFNTDGSSVEMIGGEHSPGIEMNGGSFGQTLSQSVGIATARKIKNEPGMNWTFMSDGEFQEGQIWETFMSMAFHKVDNITVIVDVNNQQVDGKMEDIMAIEPFDAKLKSFGAEVVKINGHDIKAFIDATKTAHKEKPLVILAYTCPYQGLEILKKRYPFLHYVRFKSDEEREQYRAFLEEKKKAVV